MPGTKILWGRINSGKQFRQDFGKKPLQSVNCLAEIPNSENFTLGVGVACPSPSPVCNQPNVFSRPDILDPDIREALVGGRSGLHNGQSGELVIHELGLAHAKRRVDIAVIDGELHGYEIKSEKDNLDRLDGQLQIFTQALHRLTLVVATKHLNSILGTIPAWCGVTEVRADSKDCIKLREVRKAKRNPSFDPFTFAHLLWRSEAQNLLSLFDAEPAILRAPRAILYKSLVEKTSEGQLTRMIKDAMEKRDNWRGHSQLS